MKNYLLGISCVVHLFAVAKAEVCDPNTVEHTWQQGQNNKLKIDVPGRTFKWRVEIEYDEAPNRIISYRGRGEKCKKAVNKCWFNNENHNKRQQEGDVLELGYQIQFGESSDAPQIVALTFKYCDRRPCAKWKAPDDTIKEFVLCPSEQPTEIPSGTPTEVTTYEPTEGTTGMPTEAPTASPTDEPAADPTEGTTKEPMGSCQGTLKDSNAWDAGSTGRFEIIVLEDTETWETTVTFDKPIDTFEAYQGSEVKCEDTTCTFTN